MSARHRLASRLPPPGIPYGPVDRGKRELELLIETGALLARSFDHETNLASAAKLAVPLLGDVCLMYLFETEGTILRLSACVRRFLDPRRLVRTRPLGGMFGSAILGGEWADEFAEDAEESALFRLWDFRSAMAVPIVAADRTLGAILLAAGNGRIYELPDLALVKSLAQQCALAIENARLYREAIAERDQAEKRNQAKDDFLAILSHELRNPLMPVLGWARIFKNHGAIARDPLLLDGAESLERNAEDIARLVGDCLDLARILQGKIQIETEPVDLNKVVVSSMDAVREAAWEKNLGLVAELSSGPLWISGDRTRLQQVIVNLLVNAVKYTTSGGQISVRSGRDGDTGEIEVSDTGCGIESGDLERIFEPFCQADATTLSSGLGLGLGLAISRQIVDLHGGEIRAASGGLGLGSTFQLRIPLAAPPVEAAVNFISEPPPFLMRPLRILLVEDSKDILMLMKIQLEALGHIVLVATDGVQGTERALRELPDLIISDIKMPRADGYSLIRKIRATPETASIPTIALTGLGMRADVERAQEAGFNACAVKPVDTSELLRLIQELIGPKHPG